jgi:Family of unknown function (DUF6228)
VLYGAAEGMMEAVAERFVLELPDDLMWAIDPPVDPYGDSYVHMANVEIRAHGLTAETTATVEGTGERDLADFFADLACDWRGWTGERSWRALEGEMAIEAWHDGRANVMITVTIKPPWMTFAKDAWSVRAVFTLEAGEQLSGVRPCSTALRCLEEGPLEWRPTGPKDYPDVPDTVSSAASEARAVIAAEAHRAAILMARSVIEATAKDKGVTQVGSLTRSAGCTNWA